MARLSDQPDNWVERVFSPDRRLALDFLPNPDPRSKWDLEQPDAVELRDAETGAVLGALRGWTMPLRYDWPEEGGVALELPFRIRLRIAGDLGSFTVGDEPSARPIGTLPDWLRQRSDTAQAEHLAAIKANETPRSRIAEMLAFLGLLACFGLVAGFLIWSLPIERTIAWLRGEVPERYQITGWIVRCPGPGLVMMSLQEDGRLRVPRAIAPEPLPPLGREGRVRRFGDGRTIVAVEGQNATWWPDGPGGRAVTCSSSAGGGRDEVRE